MSSTTALSRLCTKSPPATVFAVQARCARIGQAAGEQQPQILLGADDGDGVIGGIRRDDDLGEDFDDGARRLGVELAVERDNAAEGRNRIAGQRLAIGVGEVVGLGDAARIGVLDNRTSSGASRIELGDAFVTRVGIVDVVVGELLALHLTRGGDAETDVRRAIERRRLVRVLAIAQWLDQPAAEGAIAGRDIAELFGEPIGDRRVIGRRARKGLGGELAAQLQRRHAVMRFKFVNERGVIVRLDHDRDVGMVLRRGADHRHAADVDVLDAGGEIAPPPAAVASNG